MLFVSVVVLVGVSLLLCPGETIDQVVGRLVGDVAKEPVYQVLVPLQLVLNRLTEKTRSNVVKCRISGSFPVLLTIRQDKGLFAWGIAAGFGLGLGLC